MKKSILRSIKPYWLYLILMRIKTVEISKTAPKDENWNRKVFLYCSKDKKSFNRIPKEHREMMSKYIGKIACEFFCNEIEDYSKWTNDYPSLLRHINLYAGTKSDYQFLDSYLGGKMGYGWNITKLQVYDKPKKLAEFCIPCAEYDKDRPRCGDCQYYHYESNECVGFYEECVCDGLKPITRPPQSWCYIMEERNAA